MLDVAQLQLQLPHHVTATFALFLSHTHVPSSLGAVSGSVYLTAAGTGSVFLSSVGASSRLSDVFDISIMAAGGALTHTHTQRETHTETEGERDRDRDGGGEGEGDREIQMILMMIMTLIILCCLLYRPRAAVPGAHPSYLREPRRCHAQHLRYIETTACPHTPAWLWLSLSILLPLAYLPLSCCFFFFCHLRNHKCDANTCLMTLLSLPLSLTASLCHTHTHTPAGVLSKVLATAAALTAPAGVYSLLTLHGAGNYSCLLVLSCCCAVLFFAVLCC